MTYRKKGGKMGRKVKFLKTGMAGSRCGKGRSEKTATMKEDSKKARRLEGKTQAAEGKEVKDDE